MRAALVLIVATLCAAAEPPGRAALRAFQQWKQRPANAVLEWDESLSRYRASLRAAGLSERAAERTMRLIAAYDEADLYNRVYTGAPSFNTQPNRFLVEAAAAIPAAGSALDAGMGQGRNALFLASKGWKVTGFDVAEAGLRAASARAAALGLAVETVHASDEEFDFGRSKWDLIAIIHAMEKRTVHRVRRALKPGGYVIVEAALIEPGGYPHGYVKDELREVFRGYHILRYEETQAPHDFGDDLTKPEPLVRLLARKPTAPR